jgi:endonuclease/exonuclease/phosphatase family metal-dependent hydrolase
LLVIVATIVGIVGYGSVTRPTGPARGAALVGVGPQVVEGQTFRVGSYNVHGLEGTDGAPGAARIADAIERAKLHFVALQEVDGRSLLSKSDDAATLGVALKMPHLFAPTERRWFRDDFGNGILSNVPVVSWQCIPLPVGSDSSGYRNAVLSRVVITGGSFVNVLSTHIDRQAAHDEQLRTVVTMFDSLDEPAVLLGDLNTQRDHPILARLLSTPGVVDAVGDDAAAGRKQRIDWVIARGFDVVASGVGEVGPSDHPLVWAELKPKVAGR